MPAILDRTHGPELFAAMGRSYANIHKSIKPTSNPLSKTFRQTHEKT